jgi:hypothetical protein
LPVFQVASNHESRNTGRLFLRWFLAGLALRDHAIVMDIGWTARAENLFSLHDLPLDPLSS